MAQLVTRAFDILMRSRGPGNRSYGFAMYEGFLLARPKLGWAGAELKRIHFHRLRHWQRFTYLRRLLDAGLLHGPLTFTDEDLVKRRRERLPRKARRIWRRVRGLGR